MSFVDDFNAHLPAMLNRLGQTAIFTPQIGSQVLVTGIFENEYYAVPGESVEITGSQPKFSHASADIPAPKAGDGLTVDGKDYTIVIVMPDGAGVTTLILEKV